MNISPHEQVRNGRIDITNVSNSSGIGYIQNNHNMKSGNYKEAITGNWTNTVLSCAFFSKENIEIIHNGIRAGVYKMSGNKHIIANQDVNNLKIIMRSIFFDNAKFIPNQVTQEIEYLNNLVLKQCIPQILNEITSYLKYKEDVSTLAVPLSKPISDNVKGKNSLELKPFF